MNPIAFLIASLSLGTVLVGQAPQEQLGCPNQPITLVDLGGTIQPIPAGYGQVLGIYTFAFSPTPPPVRQVLPWGSAPWAPCCPNAAFMYDFAAFMFSPVESLTLPFAVPAGLSNVWVQALLYRPPFGVPCQTYVTNQVKLL